ASERGADRTGGQLEQAVPVAADETCVTGYVARCDFQAGDVRETREQSALERGRDSLLLLEDARVDRESGSVRHELQQLGVVLGERSRSEGPAGPHPARVPICAPPGA